MMKTNEPRQKRERLPEEKIPLISLILLGIALLAFVIVVVARRNVAFADFFNRRISAVLRAALAYITNPIPFSLAELLIVLLPVLLIVLIVYAVRRKTRSWRSVLVYVVSLVSAISIIFSIFVFGYGVGYYVPTLDQKLELDSVPVSAEELKDTALWLSEEISLLASDIYFGTNGASIMPYSLSEMSDKLMDSYKSLSQKHDFLQDLNSNIKPVMASVAMSHAHLTGVYTFFTGESNLNIDFPDYTLPYTAAHEFAHQRGIARENEANFIAFLACVESDDAYLRYSGYVNLYEYVVSALYSANRDMYKEVRAFLPQCVNGEMVAYSTFYDQYRHSEAAKVNNAVNNAFLQANGTAEGTKSYGMVVDLAVSYYKSINP